MEQLRSWLLGLIGAAVFCAVTAELVPRGGVKRVHSMMCSVVMSAALLLPLLRLDAGDFTLELARSREEIAAVTRTAEEISQRLNRRSIEGELEAYILDKAQTLGVPMRSVQVEARWSTKGVWYPVAVTVDGEYHEPLARLIESELGIAAPAQNWRTNEHNQPDETRENVSTE